jgi:N-acetylmuramoyl-L-alanine amidase
MPKVKFLMPSGSGNKGKGLVSAFRFGLFAQGKSRIAIDTVAPVLIDKAFVRPAENGQPARLVIDLVKASRQEFERQRRKQAATRQTSPRHTSRKHPSKTARKNGKPIVVLDPGHGGVDPGAISLKGAYEKDIVFAFCKSLKAKLEATKRYQVLMTRDEDVFVPLTERIEIARRNKADLLISVHANSVRHFPKTARKIRGASIYTLSEEASDEFAKAIAASENKADILAGAELSEAPDDDLANILIDLMHRETKNFSVIYAQQLLKSLKGQVRLTARPHRFADFRVLKAEDVPSVLLELGYLSQKQDEKAMNSDKWRSKAANAIVASLDAFFSKRQASLPH